MVHVILNLRASCLLRMKVTFSTAVKVGWILLPAIPDTAYIATPSFFLLSVLYDVCKPRKEYGK